MDKQKTISTVSLTALTFGIAIESQAAMTSFVFDQVGIFTDTIDVSGIYDVRVRGANGGGDLGGSYTRGIGALIGGQHYFAAGTSFSVLVGAAGENSYYAGGGGGMSFLNALGIGYQGFEAVAGAGGGSGSGLNTDRNGQITTSGGSGSSNTFTGGTGGLGGGAGIDNEGLTAGGGAGVYGDARQSSGFYGGLSSPSFSGGVGNFIGAGGFGGGGSSSLFTGGGGGGFSGGGGGGDYGFGGGGGGGSYLTSNFSDRVLLEGNTSDYLGINGNGYVSLELQSVPTPGGILLFASAVTGIFALKKNKAKSSKK